MNETEKRNREVDAIRKRYGITIEQAEIAFERQKVYGDPKVNHDGIAAAWSGLLEPHAESIARGEPIPAHVVALMMATLKLNRMRNIFHEDNYEDAAVYLSFARAWQREHDEQLRTDAAVADGTNDG